MLFSEIFIFCLFACITVGFIFVEYFTTVGRDSFSFNLCLFWSLFWIAISLLFGIFLWCYKGSNYANLFFSSYFLEKIFSIDNLFVFSAIFSYFSLSLKSIRFLLTIGIVGSIFFRSIFLYIGYNLLHLNDFMEIIFGALIAVLAFSMLHEKNQSNYSDSKLFNFLNKFFIIWPKDVGLRLFVKQDYVNQELKKPDNSSLLHLSGRAVYYATPMLICLLSIELIDILFALDSAPLVLSISRDPLIIATATFYSVLGLRSMYFLLEALKSIVVGLDKIIFCLMMFVAFKMIFNGCMSFIGFDIHLSNKVSFIIFYSIFIFGFLFNFIYQKNKRY